MIRWHYKLFREAEGRGVIESLINTGRNIAFGFYKKKRYVKRPINEKIQIEVAQ